MGSKPGRNSRLATTPSVPPTTPSGSRPGMGTSSVSASMGTNTARKAGQMRHALRAMNEANPGARRTSVP